ncbi:hypothetical protein GCM10010218_12700 [Streptomyces mashuensis]|uniref:Uncharacterized protein n=1 Tax=Streptomyces mashuensis TaxID=33904 RepID=A0A919EBW8_9ACTN|nr:hypothetical protein GCM10010218_12700 [Streptomyces mashuensis]
MTVPALSRRAVGLVVGAVLIIVGVVIASVAVFGSSTAPDPAPSRPPTSWPPTDEPTRGLAPERSCLMYDLECQTGEGDESSGGATSQPSTPPDDTGATAGASGLFVVTC